MLCSLPQAFAFDVPEGTTVSIAAVRKHYHKAIRYAHPDKISADAPIAAKLVARYAFSALNRKYDKLVSRAAAAGEGEVLVADTVV